MEKTLEERVNRLETQELLLKRRVDDLEREVKRLKDQIKNLRGFGSN